MRKVRFGFLVMGLIMAALTSLRAEDLSSTEPSLSAAEWGAQSALFKVTNATEEYKNVVVISRARATSGPLKPVRYTRHSFLMDPQSTREENFPIEIPSTYGNIGLEIEMYDVVDTLDQLVVSQRFYAYKKELDFPVPDALKEILDLNIEVPVMGGKNYAFDNQFGRILGMLLARGKSPDEIAALCQCRPEFVRQYISHLTEEGYVESSEGGFRPRFITIEKAQAEKLLPAIDDAAVSLAAVIAANFKVYDSTLDALAASGKLTRDPHDALDGGAILYHKYPVTLTFLLWNLLGRSFVNESLPFNIFADSDPCNNYMGDFHYLVAGGPGFNGKTFYYQTKNSMGEAIFCGYGDFEVSCPPKFVPAGPQKAVVRWDFRAGNEEYPFIFNTEKMIAPISLLMVDTYKPMETLKKEVETVMAGSSFEKYKRGALYWCWNLVVTEVMDKLTADGTMKKEGAGLYSFQRVDY